MKQSIYIFTSGRLKRKDNTLLFEDAEGKKKYIPIENTKEIFAFGELDLNAKILNLLSQKEIILHYFNYYDYYTGSFYPREHYNSGFMILNQVRFYDNEEKRLFLAKKFIEGAALNTLKIIKYYNRRDKDLRSYIEEIETLYNTMLTQESVSEAMAFEGKIKQVYYNSLNTIIDNKEFSFTKRSKRPPKDYLNTLISFSNSIIYTQVLSEIYQTHLDPRIGYLHTSNFRRFSLNLDIAEIFKLAIGDRVIFSCINKKILSESDFEKSLKGIVLNDKGKKKYLQQLEEKLKQTVYYPSLKKKISYRRLMRLELYKLEKHLMGEEEYKPFVLQN